MFLYDLTVEEQQQLRVVMDAIASFHTANQWGFRYGGASNETMVEAVARKSIERTVDRELQDTLKLKVNEALENINVDDIVAKALIAKAKEIASDELSEKLDSMFGVGEGW